MSRATSRPAWLTEIATDSERRATEARRRAHRAESEARQLAREVKKLPKASPYRVLFTNQIRRLRQDASSWKRMAEESAQLAERVTEILGDA